MIQIKFRDKVLTADQLQEMGWALIDAGNAQERYATQLAQSQADPASAKERKQADRAATSVIRTARKVLQMVLELRA